MNCDETNSLLSELLDGELPDGARAGVEAHLASCEACADGFRRLRRTVRFVRANAGAPPRRTAMGRVDEELLRAIVDDSYDRDPIRVVAEGAGAIYAPDAASNGQEPRR